MFELLSGSRFINAPGKHYLGFPFLHSRLHLPSSLVPAFCITVILTQDLIRCLQVYSSFVSILCEKNADGGMNQTSCCCAQRQIVHTIITITSLQISNRARCGTSSREMFEISDCRYLINGPKLVYNLQYRATACPAAGKHVESNPSASTFRGLPSITITQYFLPP